MREIFSLLFKEKPALILTRISQEEGETNMSAIAKNTKCTFCHVTKIIQEMEKLGLIICEKKSRSKIIKLSEKGQRVAKNMNEIYGELAQ